MKQKFRISLSEVHLRELNKHYHTYFNLKKRERGLLAKSLGLPTWKVRYWMHSKLEREKKIDEAMQQYQISAEEEPGTNVAGV